MSEDIQEYSDRVFTMNLDELCEESRALEGALRQMSLGFRGYVHDTLAKSAVTIGYLTRRLESERICNGQ